MPHPEILNWCDGTPSKNGFQAQYWNAIQYRARIPRVRRPEGNLLRESLPSCLV